MLPDRVSNAGLLTYESGALPIALPSPAGYCRDLRIFLHYIHVKHPLCSSLLNGPVLSLPKLNESTGI